MVEQGTHKPLAGGSNPPSATTPPPTSVLADAVGRGARALGVPTMRPSVLAVSGGADSMALLHGAAELVRSGQRTWRLVVAHLDHRLRAASADDAAFVTAAASWAPRAVEVRAVDVAALARETHRSIEEAGRAARYDSSRRSRRPAP